MIGTTIDGEYKITSLIGRGAFGTVYRARQLSLDRDVAVKILHAERAGRKEIQRFLNEARHLAALNHPNVVQVFALGKYEDSPYIVMELLLGRTLRAILQQPPMSTSAVVEMMLQVARGLEAIHSLSVVHRDLSTNNILIGANFVKILDLGLAKDLSRISSGTQEQYVAGTVGYISPEQIESRPLSPASDAFAFGVVLYEMLTGVNPFHAEHYMSVLYNIVHRIPEPIGQRVPGLPEPLFRLVEQCLCKNPEDRPQDMGEVARVLEEVLSAPAMQTLATRSFPSLPSVPVGLGRSSRNPYLNRTMIRRRQDFFGRKQELRRIAARLNATPPGSISIVGDRKIGKSSLMNYVYMRQNRLELLDDPDSLVMVFLDLQQEKKPTLEYFVKTLVNMTRMELHDRLDLPEGGEGLDDIRDVVEKLDAAGFRLVVLLDEFERITGDQDFELEFFSFLRFLANHYNVAYLTSSARDLQVLCHNKQISDSPFFNIFSTMRLSVFRSEEAEELVRVPSATVGRPLAPHTSEILDMAGLFPFFLQLACSHTLEYFDEHPGEDQPDFVEVRKGFYQEACFHYRHMWDGFDNEERSAIVRVARDKHIPEALRHVIRELETRQYVKPGPQLFSSTFREFVNTEANPKQPFYMRWFGKRGA